MNLELFSPTVDNRFVFYLFEFLLSGLIALVTLKARGSSEPGAPLVAQRGLLPASALLSLSLGYSTFWAGTRFFFQTHLAEPPLLLAAHICLAGAWSLVALQFLAGSRTSRTVYRTLGLGWAGLSLVPALLAHEHLYRPTLFSELARGLDWADLLILAATLYVLRHSAGLAYRILAAGLFVFLVATAVHLQIPEVMAFPLSGGQIVAWNVEQLSFSTALFLLALAIGEMSTNLLDAVFIRVHIAFILLASLIILIVTGTERSEYLLELESRTQSLGSFLTAGLEHSAREGRGLEEALNRDDLLARMTTGFGNLPELVAVRIRADREAAALQIDGNGVIRKVSGEDAEVARRALQDQNRYFRIASYPWSWRPGVAGEVELYGLKDYIDRYSRRRTVLIFGLFTGAVALATLLIGFVIQHTERTLRGQRERIRAREEELAMASKMATLGQLAGSVAHEVNTPATTILSRASYLLKRWRKRGASSDEQEDLATIMEQAQRIAQITASLLGFSRRHVLKISSVSVCQIIDKSTRLIEEDLEARGIALTVRGCPCPHLVAGDQNTLIEVFLNLVKNAMDAMPQGGGIRIDVGPRADDGSSLGIHVSDTGTGIPPEHLSEIFVPFFTTNQTGTGLGLSVVYGIISEHKGSIRVDSHPGKGTTFHIELPCWE